MSLDEREQTRWREGARGLSLLLKDVATKTPGREIAKQINDERLELSKRFDLAETGILEYSRSLWITISADTGIDVRQLLTDIEFLAQEEDLTPNNPRVTMLRGATRVDHPRLPFQASVSRNGPTTLVIFNYLPDPTHQVS